MAWRSEVSRRPGIRQGLARLGEHGMVETLRFRMPIDNEYVHEGPYELIGFLNINDTRRGGLP